MAYNPNIHHRRSIRLKGYDYSKAGLYFITICVEDRLHLFGKISSGASDIETHKDKNSKIMILNEPGKMIEKEWLALTNRFTNIELHEFNIMPNHFHGILEIVKNTDIHVRVPLVGNLDDDTSNDNNEPPNKLVRVPLVGTHDDIHVRVPLVGNLDDETSSDDNEPPNMHVRVPLVGTLDDDTSNDDNKPPNIQLPLVGNLDNLGIGQSPDKGQPQGIAPKQNKTVGDMMDAFKSITTVEYIRGVKNSGWQTFNGKLWQRNYYEHIIRNEESYHRISNYIINNPANWKDDKFNKD